MRIAIGGAQAQHPIGAVAGDAKSAANSCHRPGARKEAGLNFLAHRSSENGGGLPAGQPPVQSDALRMGEFKGLSKGEIEMNASLDPALPAMQRAWEYWARRAGCEKLLNDS